MRRVFGFIAMMILTLTSTVFAGSKTITTLDECVRSIPDSKRLMYTDYIQGYVQLYTKVTNAVVSAEEEGKIVSREGCLKASDYIATTVRSLYESMFGPSRDYMKNDVIEAFKQVSYRVCMDTRNNMMQATALAVKGAYCTLYIIDEIDNGNHVKYDLMK